MFAEPLKRISQPKCSRDMVQKPQKHTVPRNQDIDKLGGQRAH